MDVTDFLVAKLPTGPSAPGAPPNKHLKLAARVD
jgi:hypothetical protein